MTIIKRDSDPCLNNAAKITPLMNQSRLYTLSYLYCASFSCRIALIITIIISEFVPNFIEEDRLLARLLEVLGAL